MDPLLPVSGIGQGNRIQPTQANPTSKDVKKPDAKNVFESFLQSTNLDQQNSDQAVKDLIEGNASVQEVVMAVAKAEMSFQLFMEIRNQLINSCNELMRMQF